jgi:hypothetical protein
MEFEVTICTGPTALLTDDLNSDYHVLLELLADDGIQGKVTERSPSGSGVTWVEITEIWLATKGFDFVAEWAFDHALDSVSTRVKEWLRRRKRKRPQAVIIKNLMGEPERRIEVDIEGNQSEYRWVKIEPASDPLPATDASASDDEDHQKELP